VSVRGARHLSCHVRGAAGHRAALVDEVHDSLPVRDAGIGKGVRVGALTGDELQVLPQRLVQPHAVLAGAAHPGADRERPTGDRDRDPADHQLPGTPADSTTPVTLHEPAPLLGGRRELRGRAERGMGVVP